MVEGGSTHSREKSEIHDEYLLLYFVNIIILMMIPALM